MIHYELTVDTFQFAADVPVSEQICVLEDAYAEALADGCDTHTLNALFVRIKELREELAMQSRYRVVIS